METKQQIIEDAYTAAGLASYAFDLTPQELAYADRALQAMLAQWSIKGIRIGYNSGGSMSDESGLPDFSVEAVKSNLALRICGIAGKQVTPEIRAAAMAGFNAVAAATAQIPERARNINGVAAGAGNRGYGAWEIYLPEPLDTVTTGGDGPLNLGP